MTTLRRTMAALALLLATAPARAADITVLCSNGLQSALTALAPAFQAATGDRLVLTFDTANRLKAMIDGGAAFDVTILTPGMVADLEQKGRAVPGSAAPIARVGAGVAVREGAPRPDISTVAAFRQTLLDAPSVAHSSSGQSSLIFQQALDTLGIGEAVRKKARAVESGPVGMAVQRGEAALGVQLLPELMAVPGIVVVGPFPPGAQAYLVLTAGISAAAANKAGAATLIRFLRDPAQAPAYTSRGMEPS